MSSFKSICIGLTAPLLITILSACGGGGSGDTSNNGFNVNTSNANNKPQTSSEANSQVASSAANNKAESSSSSSLEQNTSSSKPTSLSSSSSSRTISNSSQSSAQSSKMTIFIDAQAPSIPDNFRTKTALYDRVVLAWDPSYDNVGVVQYRIYRNNVQIDNIYSFNTDNSYFDFDVAPNKFYTYGISAGDADGNWSAVRNLDVTTPNFVVTSSSQASTSKSGSLSSSPSSTSSSSMSSVSFSTSSLVSSSSSSAADTTTPTAPNQITKTLATTTQVDISWTSATDNIGVTGYKVYRDSALIATVSSNTLNYSDKTVVANMSYWYGVSAGDAAGNWSSQKLLNISTPPASIILGSASLKWLPPTLRENGNSLSIAEIGGYEIRYKKPLDNSYTYKTLLSNATQTTISGLAGEYTFEIAAYDTNGLFSNFVSINAQ
jgi:chitodextrinase